MTLRRAGLVFLASALAVFGLAALAIGGASSARAGIGLFACPQFIGTYLVTNPDGEGGIDSRTLLIFSADGIFQFIDSHQDGISGEYDPFTDGAGSWTCDRGSWPRTASAVAMDFTLPGTIGQDHGVGRLDFYGMSVDHSGHIEGSATLRFFPLDGDPLDPPPPNTAEPFTFEGDRVRANVQVP